MFPFSYAWPCLFTETISCLLSLFLTDGRLMIFLVKYQKSDHVISTLNHSLMTKKHLLCIMSAVQILIFMWTQRGLLFIFCDYCSFSICVCPLTLFTVLNFGNETHIYLTKMAGVLVGGLGRHKRGFLHLLIWSFVHFYLYVNIYSLFNSVHWFLNIKKKNCWNMDPIQIQTF